MKIFLNLLAATTGGQITRAYSFIESFASSSLENELVVLKKKGFLPELKSVPRITVIEITLSNGRFKSIMRMAWENFFMRKIICSNQPDIFLTFSHYLPNVSLSLPTVVAVSNLAPFSPEAFEKENLIGKLRLVILRRTISASAFRSSAIIALSKKCLETLLEIGVPSSKISVIPNGVRNVSPLTNCDPLDECKSGKYILSVSHFYRYKNYEVLLNAYSRLTSDLKDANRLTLVGKFYDKKYVVELKILAEQLGIASNVDFIDGLHGDELDKVFRGAKIFIFTSLIENSPNILLEAMSYGLPIISTYNDPMPEFGGDALIYFDPNCSSTLASNMEKLLTDDVKRSNIGVLARNKAKQYSWNDFTQKVLLLCKEVFFDKN